MLVQSPGVSRCTGFLLDARTVVTAAHCLYSARVRHLLRPDSVHVLTGYHAGRFASHVLAARYRVGTGYDPANPGAAEGADIAVLTLAKPLGGRALPLADAVPGQAAMLGGYERDRAQVLLADRDCHVTGFLADRGGRALQRHSCAGTFGTSGAPLLVRNAAGAWAAAAVQVLAMSEAAGGIAVPAAAVAALIGSK